MIERYSHIQRQHGLKRSGTRLSPKEAAHASCSRSLPLMKYLELAEGFEPPTL